MAISYLRRLHGLFFDGGAREFNIMHRRYGAKCDGVTDDTNAVNDAIEDAQPNASVTHSVGVSKAVLIPGDTLIRGQLLLREGVTLVGSSLYGSRLRVSWADGVYDKIVQINHAMGAGQAATQIKNCGLENLTIVPDYNDLTVPASTVRVLYLRNIIEFRLQNVRIIQHTQAVVGGTGALDMKALVFEACDSPDVSDLTVDDGEFGIYCDYSGTGGAVRNGRFRDLYFFNCDEKGLYLAGNSQGNQFVGVKAEVTQSNGGLRYGVHLTGANVALNQLAHVRCFGSLLSDGVRVDGSAAFNVFDDVRCTAQGNGIYAAGEGNRFYAAYGTGTTNNIADAGKNNVFYTDQAVTPAGGVNTIVHGEDEVRAAGVHRLVDDVELTAASTWYTVGHVQLPLEAGAYLVCRATAYYGGSMRTLKEAWELNRTTSGAVVITQNATETDDDSGPVFDMQIVAGSSDEYADIQIQRTAGATAVTVPVVMDLYYDTVKEASLSAGAISIRVNRGAS